MKSRPILFSGPMVRAILDGEKTQTRRIIKGIETCEKVTPCPFWNKGKLKGVFVLTQDCPYGRERDVLWVRETWQYESEATGCPDDRGVLYRATDPGWDDSKSGLTWKPSIYMPRWASRITIQTTDIRIQRLQEISEADAAEEGVSELYGDFPQWDGDPDQSRKTFRALWEKINGPGSWTQNPWVWAIEFKRL